jgi:hypothetical protein
VYYAWYNVDSEKTKERDFKLTLNVKTGTADVYMTTFIEEGTEIKGGKGTPDNVVQKLPKSKKDA